MTGRAMDYRKSAQRSKAMRDEAYSGDLIALPKERVQKVVGLVRTICKARGLPLYKVGPQVGMSTGAWSQFLYYRQLTNRELNLIKAWAKQFRKAE
jgi:hypothetical protein